MRITSGMVQRSTLADLHRLSERVAKAQQKVSSNREIQRPSDDPYNAARALQLRGSLAGVEQFQRNVTDAQGWQQAAEVAMGTITESVQRARELLVLGASDSTDAASREAIAKEVDQLILSIKESANTTYQGRYVFAGTQTDQPPYLMSGADAYQGAATVVARQVGPGVSLEIGVTAESFLGSGTAAGDGKLLDTLRTIAADLRSGDGARLRGADLTRLDANLDELLGVRALNGARQNRLDAALSRLAQVEEATVVQLSETEDADMAATLIELNSQQVAYQAALKVGATVLQTSLMDFLR